ncbi:MAG TPA: hypothetical protein VHM28_07455 [Anaerolineales bacterium]|jgi:hypothetical protein|nr:hypothetical protein [Anaerolineales bacterium]
MEPQSSDPVASKRENFLLELQANKKIKPSPKPSHRRIAGLVIGALIGLAYSLVSQFINSLLSPGIPFAHYPFGVMGNCITIILSMASIGLISAYPGDWHRGVLWGSVAIAVLLELRALLISSISLTTQLTSAFSVFAIVALIIELVFSIPPVFLLRWAIDVQEELFDKPFWIWRRIRLPLGLMIAVLGFSIFYVYPADVRDDMSNMNSIIQLGLRNPSKLPDPLSEKSTAESFLNYGTPIYTLELGDYIDFSDISPALQTENIIVIIARFNNKWALACLYRASNNAPICKSYSPDLAPPISDVRASQLYLNKN